MPNSNLNFETQNSLFLIVIVVVRGVGGVRYAVGVGGGGGWKVGVEEVVLEEGGARPVGRWW